MLQKECLALVLVQSGCAPCWKVRSSVQSECVEQRHQRIEVCECVFCTSITPRLEFSLCSPVAIRGLGLHAEIPRQVELVRQKISAVR